MGIAEFSPEAYQEETDKVNQESSVKETSETKKEE